MSTTLIKAEHLAMRFLVLNRKESTFRLLKALIRREPLRQEL